MTLMHEAARSYVPQWWRNKAEAGSGDDMCIDKAFLSEEGAKRFYQAWKDDVVATVPADKLLLFDVKSGWEPLCTFLQAGFD